MAMDESNGQRVPLMPLTKGYLHGKGFWAYFWIAVAVQGGIGLLIGSVIFLIFGGGRSPIRSAIGDVSESCAGIIGFLFTYPLSSRFTVKLLNLFYTTRPPSNVLYNLTWASTLLGTVIQIGAIACIIAYICNKFYNCIPVYLARWLIIGVILNGIAILLLAG